jgi:hypothetical protein
MRCVLAKKKNRSREAKIGAAQFSKALPTALHPQ